MPEDGNQKMKKSIPGQNQPKDDQPAEDIEKLNKDLEVWKGNYLRALADYQNLQRRVEAQKEEQERVAEGKIIGSLLDSLDTLGKAEQHLNDKGLTLGMVGVRQVLKGFGLQKLDVLNKKFNPQEMECIEVVKSDKENEVLEEVRTGYKLKERILRVAQVKVGKKKIEQKAEKLAHEELQKGDYM